MKSRSDCYSAEILAPFLQGMLPAADTEAIVAHLESCERCLTLMRSLEADDTFFRVLNKPAHRAEPRELQDMDVAGLKKKIRGMLPEPKKGAKSTPPTPQTDRNLLLGILAYQNAFITREALIAGMQAWLFDKAKSLAQVLQEQGAFDADRRNLLEALVQQHLKQHDNDAEKSLAAISSLDAVRKDLQQFTDPDVQASLGHAGKSHSTARDAGATFKPGATDQLGNRFRILRPHAVGGLGQVYVAEDQELHREVALKEIQEKHADNPDNRTRFLMEAEITGRLEHPGIVPVYGLGTYGNGRPFYAMRFIKGDSLKQAIHRFHASAATFAGLEFRKLLGRFLDVCNAIAYAHSRGVLHRDLKPGNIMLGPYGETLVVDWGLAKPIGRTDEAHRADEHTLRPSSGSGRFDTVAGQAIGTPEYMSPEQAAGRVAELGPASDVYSLGATLYSLLTGQAPFQEKELSELLRKVEAGEFAPPRQVKVNVPAELDAICRKAMATRPEDRFATPRALADDLEHWLADEPVSVCPEPWSVKVRRWVGRHRPLVSAASAAVLVAVVCLSVATGFLMDANQRERDAKDDAIRMRKIAEVKEQEAKIAREIAEKSEKDAIQQREEAYQKGQTAKEVARFLIGLFHASDPTGLEGLGFRSGRGNGAKLTARELLDRGTAKVKADLAKQPVVQAAMLDNLGNVYRSLALYDLAEPLLTEGLALRQKHVGSDHEDTAASLYHCGWLYHDQGKFHDAEKLYRQAIAIYEKRFGVHCLESTHTQFNLAWLLCQQFENNQFERPSSDRLREGEQIFRRVLKIRREKLGENHRDVGIAMAGLAGLILPTQQVEAMALAAQALNILEQADSKDLVSSAFVTYLMALQERNNSRFDKAEILYRQALKQTMAVMGDEHPMVALLLGDMAGLLRKKNDLDGAEKAIRQALDIARRCPLRGHPVMIEALLELGDHVKNHRKDLKEAESLYREAFAVAQGLERPKLEQAARTRLADLLRQTNRQAEADALNQSRP